MNITETSIPEVLLLQPHIHGDDRGFFMETFRLSYFRDRGLAVEFVQDNHSRSKRNTLRGLHFQLENPQGKLVRVLSGEVFDVAVDIRKSSPTFGRWVGEYLSSENNKQLWIPPGFAHGFYVTSETADLAYKCTDYFSPGDDHSLLWSDPNIGIEWPNHTELPFLSEKDRNAFVLEAIPKYP